MTKFNLDEYVGLARRLEKDKNVLLRSSLSKLDSLDLTDKQRAEVRKIVLDVVNDFFRLMLRRLDFNVN